MVDANKQYALDDGAINIFDGHGDNTLKSDKEMVKILRWMSSKKKDHGLPKGL
jgi:hypothetical protein